MPTMKLIRCAFVGAVKGYLAGIVLGGGGCVIVGLATGNWSAGFGVGAVINLISVLVGAVNGYVSELKEEQNCRKAAEAEEQARREAEVARLAHLSSTSRNVHSGLPALVANAEGWLDRAERDFSERAFAPFWDDVQNAIQNLACYQHGISQINRMAIEYEKHAADASFGVTPFSIPTHELPDHGPTTRRLTAVVRQAQTDFQFATIYEQRKTNQILVEGFGTLASAIYGVGDAISSSLSELSDNVHASLDDLLVATREQTELTRRATGEQAEILRRQTKQATAAAAEVAKSQKRQEEMLDNIQRRRKPLS